MNFERNIRRKQEAAFWQGWSRNYDFEHVSHAGILNGLEGIRGKETLELKPFITAGLETSEEKSPKTLAKIGGDVNYLITPTLKLNMTFNTDFAQVESDRAQINISRFSLYYPEKRQFFLEGKDHYNSGFINQTEIFYSRRIGIDNGEEVPIIAGARLMGNAGKSNIGVLSIQTAAHGEVPSTNYSVVRVRHNVFEKSSIGAIITAKNAENNYNYVFGGDFFYSTSKVLGGNNLKIGGAAAQSISYDMETTKNKAYSFLIDFPNEVFNGLLAFQAIEKNFNPEMGFMRRTNYKYAYSYLNYRPRTELLPWLRRFLFKFYEAGVYFTDDRSELESAFFNFRPFGFETKSGERLEFSLAYEFDNVKEYFGIFNGIGVPKGKYEFMNYYIGFSTFEGRQIAFTASYNIGDFYGGDKQTIYTRLRATLNRHLNISVDYTRDDIDLPEGDFSTNNIGSRVEYAFNPKLYTSVFGQWNNEMDMFVLNYRLNWIPVVGSDAYLAVNQMFSTDGSVKLRNTTILAKVIWRFGV